MGTYLSKPVLDKHEDVGEALDCEVTPLTWACVDMQGWRKTMEDAHVATASDVTPPKEIKFKPISVEFIKLQAAQSNVGISPHDANFSSASPMVIGGTEEESDIKSNDTQDSEANGDVVNQEEEGDPEKTINKRKKNNPEESSQGQQTYNTVSKSAKIFSVFDGHGGPEVARFCDRHLVDVLKSQTKWQDGEIGAALIDSFHELDRMIDNPIRRDELFDLKTNTASPETLMQTQAKTLSDAPPLSSPRQQRRGQKEKDPSMLKTSSPAEDDSDETLFDTTLSTDEGSMDEDEQVEENIENVDGIMQDDGVDLDSENDDTPPVTHQLKVSSTDAMMLIQKILAIDDGSNKSGIVTLDPNAAVGGGEGKVSITTSDGDNNAASDGDNKSERPQPLKNSSMNPTHTPSRLLNGRHVCNLPEHPIHAGCTAVVVVIIDRIVTVANAGDSRAVICRAGGIAEPLSLDHKPSQQREMSRITRAGGFVNQFGRVNGNLNLSRSVGDLKYKQTANLSPSDQMITAQPDITQILLEENDEFILLGCDGIWDCLSNEECVNFVRERINHIKPNEILAEMLDQIVSKDPKVTQGIGGDNMTCMIVDLQPQLREYFVADKKETTESVAEAMER